MPINITFDDTSSFYVASDLGMNITATLTDYTIEEYIESVIELTVLSDMSVNGTELECRSSDLDSITTLVIVNMSGKTLASYVAS